MNTELLDFATRAAKPLILPSPSSLALPLELFQASVSCCVLIPARGTGSHSDPGSTVAGLYHWLHPEPAGIGVSCSCHAQALGCRRAKWGKAKEGGGPEKETGLRIETRLGLHCGWREQVLLAAMPALGTATSTPTSTAQPIRCHGSTAMQQA